MSATDKPAIARQAWPVFTLLLAMLFGLYALLFVYTVEDRLFDTLLEREAAAQQAHYAAHGRWSPPRNGFMDVVERTDALPDGIGDVLGEEPARRMVGRDVEYRRHLPLLRAMANKARVPAPAERQRESIKQNGFARTGFTGEDGKAVQEIDIEPLDQDDVADRKPGQHAKLVLR